jgi:toxin CptA
MTIKPSPRFIVALLLFHLAAAAAVCVTEIPLAARLAALTIILLSLSCHLGRDALLLMPGSWCAVSFGQEGVEVVTRAGTRLTGKLASNTFVSPYFIALCISMEGRLLSRSRVIFADAMDAEDYRELRVQLKFNDLARVSSAADSPASRDNPC